MSLLPNNSRLPQMIQRIIGIPNCLPLGGIGGTTQFPLGYPADACLLMFSGGRDSTLAAVRMARRGLPLLLLTVSSNHLVGVERVRQRLRELAKIVPAETRWILIKQPAELGTDTSFYQQTCLPCHHAYVVVAAVLARFTGLRRLAFGYASYQSDWPEQTPLAVESLGRVLARHEVTLELPVHDIYAPQDAVRELAEFGLSTASLEQKCLRQVTNVKLDHDLLAQQVRLWEEAIDRSVAQIDAIRIEIVDAVTLGALA